MRNRQNVPNKSRAVNDPPGVLHVHEGRDVQRFRHPLAPRPEGERHFGPPRRVLHHRYARLQLPRRGVAVVHRDGVLVVPRGGRVEQHPHRTCSNKVGVGIYTVAWLWRLSFSAWWQNGGNLNSSTKPLQINFFCHILTGC